MLALGGASWSRLGSDGAWVPLLVARGVAIAPLQPSNCGFDVKGWSAHLRERFAGVPLKNVALRCAAPDGRRFEQRGEFVLTATGIEGSLVYAASALLREAIATSGSAVAEIDLLPERSAEFVRAEVARPRGSRSLSTHLKSRLGLDGAKAALLHELLPRETFTDPAALATAIKALPITPVAALPIEEAISTAGGVRFEDLDESLMLRALPGVFCTGEMIDWEAPTGGYLLTASFAGGGVHNAGIVTWNVGTVAAGASGSVSVTATVNSPLDPSVTSVTNGASLSSDQTSPITDSATTGISGRGGGGGAGSPVLKIDKSSDRTLLVPGDVVTYTLTVLNAGTAAATNIQVSDDIPEQSYFGYVQGSIAGGDSRSANGVPVGALNWTVNSLAPGSSAVLTFQMSVRRTENAAVGDELVVRVIPASSPSIPSCTTGTDRTETGPDPEANSNTCASPSMRDAVRSIFKPSLSASHAASSIERGVIPSTPS